MAKLVRGFARPRDKPTARQNLGRRKILTQPTPINKSQKDQRAEVEAFRDAFKASAMITRQTTAFDSEMLEAARFYHLQLAGG